MHSEETKKKIGAANKGKLAGEKNPIYGQKRPEYIVQILREEKINTHRMHNDELKKCRQVKKGEIIEHQIDGREFGRKRYKS